VSVPPQSDQRRNLEELRDAVDADEDQPEKTREQGQVRFTGLSRTYRIIASTTSHAQVSISPAKTDAKQHLGPQDVLAVAVGSRGTMRLPRAKTSPRGRQR